MSVTARSLRHRKWSLLLGAITVLLLISPIADVFHDQDNIISPLVGLGLLGVVFSASEKHRNAWSMAALILIWMGISLLTDGSGIFADDTWLAPILFLILVVLVLGMLARWMMRVTHIDSEVLCAGVCGYLLIGIFFTGVYALITKADPRALLSSTQARVGLGDLLYFSYTTLTTTGFGDITPKNPTLRVFTIFEAIVGVFYNTIVIARFVGLYGFGNIPRAGEMARGPALDQPPGRD